MKKRIAIYSGSFNPIHIGHTALANYICENSNIDEVWFIVSPHNPLKKRGELAEDNDRITMVNLAIDGYDHFKQCDIEQRLPRPSFTINTLEALRTQYPEYNFVLIIGADNWILFNQWKDYQHIIDQFGLIVYPREGCEVNPQTLPKNVEWCNAPLISVSSTLIRSALKERKNLRFFLPQKVYEYIEKNKLYE